VIVQSTRAITRLIAIGLTATVVLFLSHPRVAFASQAPTPSALSATDLDRIRQFKLDALEASRTGDRKRALKLYQQILQLNPDDLLALQESRTLEAKIAEDEAKAKATDLEQKERGAKERRLRELFSSIVDDLAEAKRTGSGETLAKAERALADARKIAPSGTPQLDTFQQLLEQERTAQRLRFAEKWGLVGLLVVVAVITALLYFFRRSRVLLMTQGSQPGQVFVLKKESTALGALASEVDWPIVDPLRKISRHHCDILRRGRHYFVVDRSMNGTFLNGQLLQADEPVLLRRGDLIGLSGEVTLLFR
jgi:hypothetical protein